MVLRLLSARDRVKIFTGFYTAWNFTQTFQESSLLNNLLQRYRDMQSDMQRDDDLAKPQNSHTCLTGLIQNVVYFL